MPCVLCSRSPEVGEVVYEGQSAYVMLHADSAVRGHALVISSRHVENLADLDEAEAAEFLKIERLAERALLDVTKTERAILLKLGIATPHLHLHIYPVSAKVGRPEMQRIIDAQVSEKREPGFAGTVRERFAALDFQR